MEEAGSGPIGLQGWHYPACPHPPQIPTRRLPAAKSLRIRQNLLQRLSPGPALSPLALTASVSIGLV